MDDGARRWRAAILAAAAFAFLCKITLALTTYGTNDVYAWERFARWSALFGSMVVLVAAAVKVSPSSQRPFLFASTNSSPQTPEAVTGPFQPGFFPNGVIDTALAPARNWAEECDGYANTKNKKMDNWTPIRIAAMQAFMEFTLANGSLASLSRIRISRSLAHFSLE